MIQYVILIICAVESWLLVSLILHHSQKHTQTGRLRECIYPPSEFFYSFYI